MLKHQHSTLWTNRPIQFLSFHFVRFVVCHSHFKRFFPSFVRSSKTILIEHQSIREWIACTRVCLFICNECNSKPPEKPNWNLYILFVFFFYLRVGVRVCVCVLYFTTQYTANAELGIEIDDDLFSNKCRIPKWNRNQKKRNRITLLRIE